MTEYQQELVAFWNADIYDQQETDTDDVTFLLGVLGDKKQNVLEVCCGSGRILVPLARAGHIVSGFDMDDAMLARLSPKVKELNNLQFYKADAVEDDWGYDYDTVVLAGNILINIDTAMDYKAAQQLFIRRAAACVHKGGHVFLDFNYLREPAPFFGRTSERVYFDGTDAHGTYGRYIGMGGTYDVNTQICMYRNRTEITPLDGEPFVVHRRFMKHIPTVDQVTEWLREAGCSIKAIYGDYQGNPIGDSTCRAIVWAEKGG